MQPEPFRIEPTFSPRIWGSRTLAPIFPEKTDLVEPIGEAWLTDVRCHIANGAFRGKTLDEAWTKMPADWQGERCADMANFPLLVKFIFPADKLSIQVHPDDAYAQAHEVAAGGRGKTEMWHAVSAEPDAKLLLGLKSGATKQKFSAAVGSNELETFFQEHGVEHSDTFFVRAGTPHSIGPGMILCEVQEYSDLTYRVYDYGRTDAQGKPRQLHVEKALDVIRFDDAPIAKVRPLRWGSPQMEISLLAACRYFATEHWRLGERFTARPQTDAFNLLVVLSGNGDLRWENDRARYGRGECWFVPAALREYDIIPDDQTELLRTFVPDLDSLRKNLRSLGIAESRIADTVFG